MNINNSYRNDSNGYGYGSGYGQGNMYRSDMFGNSPVQREVAERWNNHANANDLAEMIKGINQHNERVDKEQGIKRVKIRHDPGLGH